MPYKLKRFSNIDYMFKPYSLKRGILFKTDVPVIRDYPSEFETVTPLDYGRILLQSDLQHVVNDMKKSSAKPDERLA